MSIFSRKTKVTPEELGELIFHFWSGIFTEEMTRPLTSKERELWAGIGIQEAAKSKVGWVSGLMYVFLVHPIVKVKFEAHSSEVLGRFWELVLKFLEETMELSHTDALKLLFQSIGSFEEVWNRSREKEGRLGQDYWIAKFATEETFRGEEIIIERIIYFTTLYRSFMTALENLLNEYKITVS